MRAMSWWQRVKKVLDREAADLKEGIETLGSVLDEELARRERELNATPAERLDMVLEEIEESDARIEELATGIAVSSHEAPAPARHPRARLLDPGDVEDVPHLDTALGWVTVEDVQEADPLSERFDHCAWIEERAGSVITEADPTTLAAQIADHPLVDEVIHEDRDVLYVRAPTLHHDDVRLLVAAALARRITTGWRTA